jgi:cyanophycinase
VNTKPTAGALVLMGGSEWTEGAPDEPALTAGPVVVLPTAAAYENPGRLLDRCAAWHEARGVEVEVLPVYRRQEGFEPATIERLRSAGCVFLTSGSGMHLRSVLLGSPLLDAVVAAWHGGATLAASGQSATTLCDPMVDGRGGAFTVGLGIVRALTVVPRLDEWSEDKLHRSLKLAPGGLCVAGVEHRGAVVHEPGRGWRTAGSGAARVWRDGVEVGVDALTDPS